MDKFSYNSEIEILESFGKLPKRTLLPYFKDDEEMTSFVRNYYCVAVEYKEDGIIKEISVISNKELNAKLNGLGIDSKLNENKSISRNYNLDLVYYMNPDKEDINKFINFHNDVNSKLGANEYKKEILNLLSKIYENLFKEN